VSRGASGRIVDATPPAIAGSIGAESSGSAPSASLPGVFATAGGAVATVTSDTASVVSEAPAVSAAAGAVGSTAGNTGSARCGSKLSGST
jgi:hypothetical protein